MRKNPLINIVPKVKDNVIKDENFTNAKNSTFLLERKSTDEIISDSINKNFNLKKNKLSAKDKKIILKVIESYKKRINSQSLSEDEFVLTKHEINEFFSLENKNILRYIIYRYKYNIYPRLKLLEEYPPNIQIEPTSMCNLRCIMCYQSDKSFSSKSAGFMGYMKLDLLKKIVDEIEGKIEGVTFASRGEPTLHKQLDEFLKYCEGKFLGLKLNTNATLLDEKKINALLSSDLQSLVLSIDEKNKENYEKIRVNAKFEKIMRNLELLKNIREKKYKNSKIKIRISGVKINTEQNVDEMNQFYREFADEIALVDYSPWESAYDNEVNDIQAECSELYRRIFVWQDGKVNPCDYDYKSILSKWNANEHSIKSIWNSNYYNEIRRRHKLKERKKIEPCSRCIGT